MMEDTNPPSSVGEVLNNLLRRCGMDTKIREMSVLRSWPQVVGEAISKHSQPVAIRKGNLFVNVDSSVWLAQLSHFKTKIILEFNKRSGRELIQDIYFRLGSVSSSPYRKRKATSGLDRVTLDKEDVEWIDKTATRIKDHNLRRLLKRILSQHKRLEKLKR